MTLILHGGVPSPFFRKVRVALHEKGLDYEVKQLIPFPKTPELLAMNPLGKIPILEEGDLVLPDSSVICAYLERTHPEPSLYPADPREYARALWFQQYSDTQLAAAIGPIFLQRFINPNLFKRETDEAAVEDALQNLVPPAFDYVESQLPDGRDTILGGLSIADIAIGSLLQGLVLAKTEIDGARWPKLARYIDGLHARPSFQKAMS